MAQTTFRANLTAAEYPFLSELQGRNVIVMNIDQNYSRQASSAKNKDRDIGIAQIYYMHNVIPTDAGVCSVAYGDIIGPPDTDSLFTDIYKLRDVNEVVTYLAVTSSGKNYALSDFNIGWQRTTDLAPMPGKFVTVAHVNGQSYICYAGMGVYKYSIATNSLVLVNLTTLSVPTLMGICASNGYMIAWTDTSVMWSSTIDPTDFTPSLVTGAGDTSIQQAKGKIVCCLPQNGGFVIYSKANAVSMVYTNNLQYPFNANEIIGCGGLSTPNLVAYDGNSTDHVAYTSSGLQDVSMSTATIMSPQATDFLAGSSFEDFDELTNVFTVSPLNAPMNKKVVVVANRYIVISYGRTTLTHALIYDIALARWGKFKIDHVDCFDYQYPSPEVVDTPKRSIGFLQANGTIKVVIMSYDTTGSYGVMVCGKYQIDRNHYIDLQEIHLESIKTGNQLKLAVLTSVDGKNNIRTTFPALVINDNTYRRYNCRTAGLNHSIVLSGAFHTHSLELKFSDSGIVR